MPLYKRVRRCCWVLSKVFRRKVCCWAEGDSPYFVFAWRNRCYLQVTKWINGIPTECWEDLGKYEPFPRWVQWLTQLYCGKRGDPDVRP